MNIDSYTLRFQHTPEIDASEFADFLFLFRGVYAAALQVINCGSSSEQQLEPEALAGLVVNHLARLEVSGLDLLFRQDLGPQRLLTKRMSHQSPLELVVTGVVLAIAAAVILSGGKLKLFGVFQADLLPIGDGIKKLKEALAHSTRAPVGYGIRSRKIKLSKTEYDELMRQDATQRDRGGFQRFLVGLQFRVNKSTRTLDLSEDDMVRIVRHGKDPRKGGWQARIRRIFGHHFDFGGDS
jgi:hypothetical protein